MACPNTYVNRTKTILSLWERSPSKEKGPIAEVTYPTLVDFKKRQIVNFVSEREGTPNGTFRVVS